jgi:glutamine amidotransferase
MSAPTKLTVVDYGLGNLASVANALKELEIAFEVTGDPSVVGKAGALVLPGVGAAGQGMRNLRERGLDGVVVSAARAGVPVLGICLGMQLLMNFSEEDEADCLGLVDGEVRKFRTELKVPHMGWNVVEGAGSSALLRGLGGSYFYFVHSYYCDPDDAGCVKGTTEYGEAFCSVIERGNIYGVQFHPEKSGEAGLQLLRNFWEAACR